MDRNEEETLSFVIPGRACKARARNPSDLMFGRQMDSGLALRAPRNDDVEGASATFSLSSRASVRSTRRPGTH